MKRAISLFLCMLMLISALPVAAESDWEYTITDKIAVLTRYIGGGEAPLHIEIPKTLGGAKVKRLSWGAFDLCPAIASLSFPRKNVDIDPGALDGLSGLIVYCRAGGTVEAFCLENGFEYELLPENTPAPEPFESTAPAPSETITPAPSETMTPEPSETITPAPSETITPEPSQEPTIAPEPTEIVIDVKKATLGVGQVWVIPARAVPDGQLTYKSLNKKIAKVDKDGCVTGIKKGSAKIEIATANGLTAKVKIKVAAAPKKITAAPELKTMGVGETCAISWSITEGSAAEVTFKSSKPDIASVSETGVITALSEGKAKITARTHNGKKASFTITVKAAPTEITCEMPALMGKKQQHTLKPTLSEGSSSKLTYSSSDPAVAKVNAKGVVTAKAPGEAVIRASTYAEGVFCEMPVTVTEAPAYVSIGIKKLTLGVGDSHLLTPDAGGMGASYTFKSSNTRVAKVNANGMITALRTGSASITVAAYNGKKASMRVTVKKAPSSIRFQAAEVKFFYRDVFHLSWSMPEGSHSAVTFASSDEGVATVDENGLVTGVAPGECTVTAATSNGKTDTCRVVAYDESYPVTMTLDSARYYVGEGDVFAPSVSVQPENADARVKWTSSRKAVATVDGDGNVKGVAHGSAVISGISVANPDIKLSYEIIVLSDDRCLVMPEQRTSPDALQANLKKISAVEASALNQLDILFADGKIGEKERDRRAKIIARAFDMYAFPFMVEKPQPYWRARNSEGGKKDFMPGVMYYGMPYISGSGDNREYNASKAVRQGYYTDVGEYYMMNQKKRINGNYVGNDCSSFVSMATWGTNTAYSYMRTDRIAASPLYVTVSDQTALRPGDLINKADTHVVMFLYYADKAKKQMVIIEQGGRGDYTNTVWCSIVSVNSYLNGGYKIRRLRTY